MNFIRSIFIRTLSLVYRVFHKYFGVGTKHWPEEEKDRLKNKSKTFRSFVKIRELEAKSFPKGENVLDGDSIAHLGEHIYEVSSIENPRCYAIGGDTVGGLLDRIKINAGLAAPKKVAFHISGNNFISGHNEKYILSYLKKIVKEYKKFGVQEIYWITTVPLGKEHTGLNQKIKKFVNKVQKSKFVDTIDIRSSLENEEGFIKDEYRTFDGIHVNELAYIDVIIPILSRVFRD